MIASPLEHGSIARRSCTSGRCSDIAHRPYRRSTDTGTDSLVRSITAWIGSRCSIGLTSGSTGCICGSSLSTNRYCCPPRIVRDIAIDDSTHCDLSTTRGGSRIIPSGECISSKSWIRGQSSYCSATGYRFRSWCMSSSSVAIEGDRWQECRASTIAIAPGEFCIGTRPHLTTTSTTKYHRR